MQQNVNVKKGTIPTWGIVLAFIIFWPVGILLLFLRIATDRSATMKSGIGKAISVVSYVLLGFAGIFLLMAIFSDTSMLFAAVLFGVGGILVNNFARNMKKAGLRYKRYIDLVVNRNMTSIQSIANDTGVDYNTAVIDLQKMIQLGYFTGAQLDPTRGTIFLGGQPVMQQTAYGAQGIAQQVAQAFNPAFQQQQQSFAQQQAQVAVKACPSCGANGRVTAGQAAECEYCGTLLT